MKHNYLLLLFLFAVGLFSGFSQKISSQKGLTTAIFNLQAGTIKVYLPDDIRPGDVISGRIIAEPLGKNTKQKASNLAELKKYSISFNNEKFAIANTNNPIRFAIQTGKYVSARMELISDIKTVEGEVVDVHIQKGGKEMPVPECGIPTHALTNAPLNIPGKFDGDASNTNCLLDNKPMEILAESPRQCIVSFPADAKGTQNLSVQEKGGQPCMKNVSAVNMDVSAGRLNLRKGEKTYIDVKITGLQNLPDTAILTLNNITTPVVTMMPSNNIIIPLAPDSVGSGTFTKRFDIQSIVAGSFTVNVNLDLPETPSVFASVNTGVEKPPVYADVRKPEGGKRDEGVLTAGTHTALGKGMQKWADANTEGKNPIDYQCENCFQCIKSVTFESNVSQIGSLGWGIITTFLSGGINFAGGILAKVKDIADKGGDIYKAIKELIDDGKIQVIGIKEQWCPGNEYCKVTGIIVYDVKTGCVEAIYKCTGTKMCCPFPETTYKLSYCLDKDGAVIDDTIKMEISH